jgi:hypothetical protein
MAFQVINRDERLFVDEGDCFAGHHADDHPADEARPAGRRHRIEVAIADPRLRHRLPHQPVQPVQVRAGGDFRDHAAIGPVILQLRRDQIGSNPSSQAVGVRHHGGGGFIATGFDAQNDHGGDAQRCLGCIRMARPLCKASYGGT